MTISLLASAPVPKYTWGPCWRGLQHDECRGGLRNSQKRLGRKFGLESKSRPPLNQCGQVTNRRDRSNQVLDVLLEDLGEMRFLKILRIKEVRPGVATGKTETGSDVAIDIAK